MCGSETLAMEESSTSMKVAKRDRERDGPGIMRRLPILMRSGGASFSNSRMRTSGSDRHAGAQAIEPVLIGLEAQADGDALHHFDVVAGGVFGRQDAGNRAGAAADGFDVAFKILPQRVHVNADRLARMDVVHLRFFEIRR